MSKTPCTHLTVLLPDRVALTVEWFTHPLRINSNESSLLSNLFSLWIRAHLWVGAVGSYFCVLGLRPVGVRESLGSGWLWKRAEERRHEREEWAHSCSPHPQPYVWDSAYITSGIISACAVLFNTADDSSWLLFFIQKHVNNISLMPTMSDDAVWPHRRGQSVVMYRLLHWYFTLTAIISQLCSTCARMLQDISGPAMTTIIHDCGHMRKQALIHLNRVERASIVVTDSIRTDEKL